MSHAERKDLVDRQRPYVLEQVEHMRKRGYLFADWVVLFVVADPADADAMKLARMCGWQENSGTDLLCVLTSRAELCATMRANKILEAGIVEQTIQPGKLRCVVFDQGIGIVDVDVPLSIGN
ncbi:hypothetical protein BH11MYX4_BH11MYX4_03850 [soil metagenome]